MVIVSELWHVKLVNIDSLGAFLNEFVAHVLFV